MKIVIACLAVPEFEILCCSFFRIMGWQVDVVTLARKAEVCFLSVHVHVHGHVMRIVVIHFFLATMFICKGIKCWTTHMP